ncbi:hypothetical protein MKQ68_09355 [Chitinophaga horti]|uniref:DUF748 domain-containing protein n=1 Tax=Chitinophaga horti TaxID=2920382 RepID=A0ABY6J9Q8_9BACT|nr:hypothetical protein [Chitinophaga horti]UYQ95302.1 hypothetical protein MKQ68_09355 [Chitinophaga horti]
MKLSARQKKWIKVLLILVGIRLVVGLLLYYVIEYRFREVIQVLVERESGGKYHFDAEDVDFSIWKKNIRLKNASVMATDTGDAVTRHQVKIPEVYLAIQSWKELIFHRQVYVDSLSIQLPDVSTIAAARAARRSSVTLQASEIFRVMRNTMKQLHVRRLNLHNGAFSYTSTPGPPFRSSQINLTASNVGSDDSTDNRFLFADDIDLSITDQHWLMAGGVKEIKFRRLHFSSSNQFFEADSCMVTTAPQNGQPGVTLSADKLFFKGHDLAAIYERDMLLLDTIICYHPVITLSPRNGKRERQKADTGSIVRQTISKMFKGINLKYVDVREGQVRMNYDSTQEAGYVTERTSLKIYNLNVQNETKPHITTDSVDLRLKGINFYTADSLYKLTIDEFSLNRQDIVFRHAEFTPTEKNNQQKGLSFTAPHLRLNNFSLEDLIMRRLHAEEAILESPRIKFYSNKKSKKPGDSTVNISGVYQTLNGVSELIKVTRFRVTDGRVEYQPGVRQKAVIASINANILLSQLLQSDSLINIKQSILQFDVDRISVNFPKLALQAKDMRINGVEGTTYIGALDMELGANIHLNAQQVYWLNLNWDAFQQDNNIIADSIHIRKVAVDVGRRPTRNAKKAMPFVRIHKTGIEQVIFDGALAENSQLVFNVNRLYVDELSSEEQYLLWERARGQVTGIRFNSENMQAKVDRLSLDTRRESVMSQAHVTTHTADITLPELRFHGDLRSTGARQIRVADMQASAPVVKLSSGPANAKASRDLKIPVDLSVERMLVRNGLLSFQGNDSLSLQAGLNARLQRLVTTPGQRKALSYGLLEVDLSTIQLNGQYMQGGAGTASIQLSNGVLSTDHSLLTTLGADWKDVAFQLEKPDSTALSVGPMTGQLHYPGFRYAPGKPINWAAFLDKASFETGPVDWRNKERAAHVNNIHWTKNGEVLQIDSLAMAPHTNEETFVAAQAYQVPYLALQTSKITMAGLHERDSAWQVRKVAVDGVQFTTAKDKRKPLPPGPDKPMLTQLLARVGVPFHADSLLINDALVVTKETSPKTKMTSHIPVEHITLLARNAGNRQPAGQDSLILEAQLQLFNNQIRRLYYSESYSDSLAGFTMDVSVSPMHLPHLSHITTPLAAISVSKGEADTLHYHLYGNKYAAEGVMHFVYKDLRVRLLSLPDTSRNGLFTRLKNWAANSIVLNRRNSKEAYIFFDRDPQKLFLNYWIKSTLRGLLASAGIKKNKKYYRRYARQHESYKLPKKQ